MREIPRTALPHKFAHELHCNEIMLLPYYIASMNIEHAYFEATGQYEPFEGICLVDTFETAERRLDQGVASKSAGILQPTRTPRASSGRSRPPSSSSSAIRPTTPARPNENDNNKNRKYPVIDRRVADTYAADSKATLRNKLSDPYVKAIRWASDRIGQDGIVAFVTNNGFLDDIACDGMRKHLARRLRRHLRARPGRQRAQEPQAFGHDAQRLRHSGRREHQPPGAEPDRQEQEAGQTSHLLRRCADRLAARGEIPFPRRQSIGSQH